MATLREYEFTPGIREWAEGLRRHNLGPRPLDDRTRADLAALAKIPHGNREMFFADLDVLLCWAFSRHRHQLSPIAFNILTKQIISTARQLNALIQRLDRAGKAYIGLQMEGRGSFVDVNQWQEANADAIEAVEAARKAPKPPSQEPSRNRFIVQLYHIAQHAGGALTPNKSDTQDPERSTLWQALKLLREFLPPGFLRTRKAPFISHAQMKRIIDKETA